MEGVVRKKKGRLLAFITGCKSRTELDLNPVRPIPFARGKKKRNLREKWNSGKRAAATQLAWQARPKAELLATVRADDAQG